MDRYLKKEIYVALEKKIVFLSGPRQTGKTTLAKSLFQNIDYLNYDDELHRERIFKRRWKRDVECIIFDELHKMKDWKRWLKGIYDTEGIQPKILVTGSAHMDAFSKVGDSMAGRYRHFTIFPIDVYEGVNYWRPESDVVVAQLMKMGGFPEPFLENDIDFYRVWQKTHLDIILRQDFLDLYSVRSIKNIEILLQLLIPRVSSSVSYSNLATDLQVDHNTIKSWIAALENIYAIFKVTPYHKNIARALLKEPKFYFYDIGRTREPGARLENLVGLCLLKQLNYLGDTKGWDVQLHYLRTKDGIEVDFLVVVDNHPLLAIEVKTADADIAKGLKHFKKFLPHTRMLQLVWDLNDEYDTPDGIQVRKLDKYLAELDIHLSTLMAKIKNLTPYRHGMV
jgi:predicted AAA+ superfamily ATPase